jgi:hypothetical protein
MTDKQKAVFELISKYAQSRGCEYFEVDIDAWNNRPYNGRNFGCGIDQSEKQDKLPFDASEIITEFLNSLDHEFDEDNLTGMTFKLFPKTRKIIVSGIYQDLGDGGSSELEVDEESDENLKPIMDELKEKGVYPYAEVRFNGGGDDGYIESEMIIDSGRKPSQILENFAGLDDFLYNMLSNFGGWEIDEGSYGNFIIGTKTGVIKLELTWNEYKYEDVVFGEYDF